MKTVLMANAVIKDGERILLRKFDPARNLYCKPWGLFGGRLEGVEGVAYCYCIIS